MRRECPPSSPLHHARRLRLSILLLQLLCLPPCCVPVDAPQTAAASREETEMQHEQNGASLSEHRYYLRSKPSSMTGRSTSALMDVLYALLGSTNDSIVVSLLSSDKYGVTSESNFVIETIGESSAGNLHREGQFDDNTESAERGGDRRLQSRTSNSEWCKHFFDLNKHSICLFICHLVNVLTPHRLISTLQTSTGSTPNASNRAIPVQPRTRTAPVSPFEKTSSSHPPRRAAKP